MKETPQSANPADSGEREQTDASTLSGRVIDERYQLESHLGGGGMGEVYRAEHTMMHKTVAVKLLRPEVANDESIIERFRREAAAAANLDHPNICAATDFGKTEDGLFFLVMEYVDGESLQDVLERRGPLPIDEIVEIADGIAAALEKADELDVVHRDIKPDNVMLVGGSTRGPDVKVLDFGVAHVEFNDQMPSLTKTGAVFGTPSYMSPEQATGETVGPGADLYGLGAVIYEMLTGREVFEAEESAQLMAKHIMEEPEPPSKFRNRDDIPPDLEALVMELLEKKPEDRPGSATDVRRRLNRDSGSFVPSGAGATPSPRHQTPADRDERDSLAERVKAKSTELLDTLRSGDIKDQPFNLALLGVAGVLALMFTLLVGTSFFLMFGDSPAETRQSLSAERAEFRKQKEIEQALEPLENGRPAETVEELEALREKRGDRASAHLHYLTAKAYAKIGNETRALEAFHAAAEANETYVYDETLLEHVMNALADDYSEVVDRGRAFVRKFGSREPLRNRVATLAWKSDSEETRNRAYELLESQDLLGSLPEWQRLSIAMRRADNCDDWEQRIDALVALGDPRGAQILEIYEDKPTRGCGPPLLKVRDCYRCIRAELDKGIDALQKAE